MDLLSENFNKEQLFNEFKVVISDAEALLKATAGQGGEKIAELRAKAEQSLKTVKARLDDAEFAMLAKTKAAAKATDVYVHENPWRSVASAASVGLVVGLLIARR